MAGKLRHSDRLQKAVDAFMAAYGDFELADLADGQVSMDGKAPGSPSSSSATSSPGRPETVTSKSPPSKTDAPGSTLSGPRTRP